MTCIGGYHPVISALSEHTFWRKLLTDFVILLPRPSLGITQSCHLSELR
ncbi:hypothetical protein C427_2196 [Paraglaciecola psychrophila 170]|uniref:Uncharacterized protein n=1 Tax=Paraglaciecola psychrophila 170 TaxID=1129794 RepID=K7ACV7_9ALTE|nr:hypothetical protein C427_2196 [Paraglaciecola psychrophila 170]GAC38503.1 hypothetical protein GPSY_2892 [Paraglaciecola psychrophila 170]